MSKLIDKLAEITQAFPFRSEPIYLTPDQFAEVRDHWEPQGDPEAEVKPWGFDGTVGRVYAIHVIPVDTIEESTPYIEGWEL